MICYWVKELWWNIYSETSMLLVIENNTVTQICYQVTLDWCIALYANCVPLVVCMHLQHQQTSYTIALVSFFCLLDVDITVALMIIQEKTLTMNS